MGTYVWKTAKNPTMHVEEYTRSGEPTGKALCGETGFDRSVNMPFRLGQPVCKKCEAAMESEPA